MPITKQLTIAICVFLLGLGFLYFYTQDKVTDSEEIDWIGFSTVSNRSEAVAHYPASAFSLSSVNEYPTLMRLFDPREITAWLTIDLLRAEAQRLKARQANNNEFSSSYVYQTSYFIGNLLVAGDQHLSQVLTDKPASAYLVEYALTDLRAVTTQIQDLFDVAPARFYQDGLEPGLYYDHPSFPSLTTAEAYLVYLLLAEIDPKNARHYALMAGQFVEAIRASAVHYDFDIDYALELAALLLPIILEHPRYEGFFAAALTEWGSYQPRSVWSSLPREFLPGFSYSRRISVPASGASEAGLVEGSLVLSLVDNRLPQSSRKLYELNLLDGQLTPFALDLTPARTPELLPSLGDFVPRLSDGYHFSGSSFRQLNRLDSRAILPAQIWRRDDQVSSPRLVFQADAVESINQLLVNRSGTHLLARGVAGNVFVYDVGSGQRGELIPAKAGAWAGNSALWLVTEQGLERYELETERRYFLTLPNDEPPNNEYLLVGDEVGGEVIVIRQSFSPTKLQFQAELLRYSRQLDEWFLVGTSVINDAKVVSAALSPDADHIALLVSDGITNIAGSILLFNTKNGIIKRDIPLPNFFSPGNRSVEAWVFSD